MKIKINGEVMMAVSMYLLIFYLCLPFSMVILNSALIHLIVFAAAAFFILGMILSGKLNQLMLFVLLFFFTFLYWVITWRVQLNSLTYVYYCFASLLFVFGGTALYKSKDKKMVRHLFIFLSMIYFVTAITSIIGLNRYPLASRELGRGATYDTSLDFVKYKNIYHRMNIASWGQVYGMLFAIPAALMIWKRKRKLFFLALLIATFIMLISSQITFAVLLAAALIIGGFISQESNSKTILFTIAIALAVVIVLLYLENILSTVINLTEQAGLDFLTIKLNDMKVLLLYKSAIGDASARGILYQRSIDTFLDNPVVGLIFSGRASLDKIGHHSEFLDILGTFGFIGLAIMIGAFLAYFRFLKKTEKQRRKDLLIIYFVFIVLFIINPVFNSPQIFVGAFLYPLLASRHCDLRERDENRGFLLKLKLH